MARKNPAKFAEERSPAPLYAKNDHQVDYITSIMTCPQVVVLGPAGTGKTYIASTCAANMLRLRKVGKIILTRPNVPGGRSLGYFPGTMEEKIAPWVVPFTSVISDHLGKGAFEIAMKSGDIEIVPFEVMRGRTFDNAFVILDEAQNTTPLEMKMFLTRVGEGSKVVINGDVKQSDLKETSGLTRVLQLIHHNDLPVPVIEFTHEDIVRSEICAMWIKAFDNNEDI